MPPDQAEGFATASGQRSSVGVALALAAVALAAAALPLLGDGLSISQQLKGLCGRPPSYTRRKL